MTGDLKLRLFPPIHKGNLYVPTCIFPVHTDTAGLEFNAATYLITIIGIAVGRSSPHAFSSPGVVQDLVLDSSSSQFSAPHQGLNIRVNTWL